MTCLHREALYRGLCHIDMMPLALCSLCPCRDPTVQHVFNVIGHLDHYLALVREVKCHSQVLMYPTTLYGDGSLLAKLVLISVISIFTCKSFRSSTCQRTVHCFPSIILLAMHQSYELISKPHAMRAALSLRQNKSAACSVPMQCLEQLDIEDRLAILIYDVLAIQLWVQLASAPSKRTWTTSSVPACMNAPGMSTVTMSRHSFASIVHDNISASTDTAGALASSLRLF